MKRIVFFLYGVFCHVLFFGVFAYLAGFMGNLLVPKTLDGPAVEGSLAAAVVIDLALLLAFALQHSVMARLGFKRVWTRFVPPPIERSTYVLIANLMTMLLMWQWRPIPIVIWEVTNPVGWWIATGLYVVGLLIVPAVSLMISHFDLFGTRQVWLHLQGKDYTSLPFRTPLAYAFVRHPLYIGWAIAFWATPTMTVGHALFAAFLTGYMGVATLWEERDLIEAFGKQYLDYRRRVPRFLPIPVRRPEESLPKAELAETGS